MYYTRENSPYQCFPTVMCGWSKNSPEMRRVHRLLFLLVPHFKKCVLKHIVLALCDVINNKASISAGQNQGFLLETVNKGLSMLIYGVGFFWDN